MICFTRGLLNTREELVAGWPSGTGRWPLPLASPCRIDALTLLPSVFSVHVIWRIDNGGPDCPGPFCLPRVLSRPTRTSQRDTQAFEVSAHSLTPVSIHTNHRRGRWVVDWPVGAGLAGPCSARGRQCTNVSPYQGRTSPPVDPSPKVRSPMSPKSPGIPVPPPSLAPVNSHVSAHAMCGLSLAGREPDWGPRDRPPPGPGR
jgi:hypothetical protein